MKRMVLSAISLGMLAATSAAHAQSSVTLYGLIDNSITYIHNDGGKNTVAMVSGNLQGSRWGLKGAEDLGGGLKAVFQLENGFDPNTGKLGQGGAEFGRQAYIGLSDDRFGTVKAGRQFVPDTDLVQGITGDNYFGSVFATPGDVDNYDNSVRVSNSLKYISPVFAGFQAEAMYAFGNQAGSIGDRRAWGAALAYTNGPVALAASYQYYNGGNVTGVRKFNGGTNTTSDSIFNGPINASYDSAASVKIARVAGQYTVGSFNLGASYSNAQYTADSHSSFGQTQKYNTGNAFATYQVTPAFLTGIGYSYTKSSGNSSAKYNQVSLGADYNLSKRTDFYLVGAWQHASGQQDPAGNQAQASIGSYGFAGANGASQEYVALGIRHKF
ncbi:porin [Burkholderia ubonensis]|uniref:porin n=1 Tax=Burkholderia ubonensis TaxID=101571 RepID=UPI00075699BB|nr:porin [Burkholderia ubonensis]KVC84817.1 porin [Burkholderia ubonensis]